MATVQHQNIPTIDISSLLISNCVPAGAECSLETYKNSAAIDTIKQISQALLEYGFFYATNHGIDGKLQAAVFEQAKKFFDLPHNTKNEIHKPEGGYRGYFGMKEEISTESKVADWKEGIYYFLDFELASNQAEKVFSGKNPWPRQEYLPGFQGVMKEYFEKGIALGSVLLGAISVGLGLERTFFETRCKQDPFAQLAIFHYPPNTNDSTCKWGVQEHTDYGFITILMQDDVGGLQVKLKDGTWIEAPYVPNSFVINIGDGMEIFTSGAYSARPHRVLTSRTHHRYSIPLFYDPSLDCVIDQIPIENTVIPLKCTKTKFNVKFPFSYGSYVLDKYQTIIPKK